MHELSIAQNIAEIICQSVPEQLYSQAEFAKVKIGKLSNIFPQALRSGFDVIKQNYGFRNIELLIEEEALHLKCRDCGRSSESDEIVFQCKYCQSMNLEVIDGDKLQLFQITLKEE